MKKHLSEYLKENINIRSLGNKICIVSGVGSGKNYWVENELTKLGNVLVITSRKAKKDETILQSIFEGTYKGSDFEHYFCCTNSHLELLVKNCLIKGNSQSLCEYFDFVVLDEAHSLITDSTFSDAPFHVYTFINEVSKYLPVILMTATIKPIEKILKANKWKIVDCMEQCINIIPKRVVIDTKENILNELSNKSGKIIYMANSANGIIEELYPEFQKIFQKHEIAFSMSETAAGEKLKGKYPEEYRRLQEGYRSIVESNKLPDDIKLLLTTSRLKEGINIKDKEVEIIVCESHVAADMIQLAGRVRHGVNTFYIIDNAKQNNNNKLSEIDYFFSKDYLIDACNCHIKEIEKPEDKLMQEVLGAIYSEAISNSKIRNFIDFIEEQRNFQYTRYNHIENTFELYELRHSALLQFNSDLEKYACDTNKFVMKAFNSSNIKFENKIKNRRKKEILEKNMLSNILLDILKSWSENEKRIFDGNDRKKVKHIFCKWLDLKQNTKIDNINKAIERKGLPYELISKKDKKGETRDKTYITAKKRYID